MEATQQESEIASLDEGQIIEKFHKLEIKCIGYDNFVDCEEANYLETLEDLRKLIIQIQKNSLFSPNEELAEIETDHVKLLMAPFYQADVLFRIMDNRAERVKLAHVFWLEYLRLLNHYGVLDKAQEQHWKFYMNKHKVSAINELKDATVDDVKEAKKMMEELQQQRPDAYSNREQKIAEFRQKKEIEAALDMLKGYKDEQMKREFYMSQIKRSVLVSFE